MTTPQEEQQGYALAEQEDQGSDLASSTGLSSPLHARDRRPLAVLLPPKGHGVGSGP